MMKDENSIFEELRKAATPEEERQLGRRIAEGGYSRFSELLESFRHWMKTADESSIGQVKEWIRKGRRIIPEPGRISPSWTHVWEELERFLRHKERALRQVPPHEREGEWQIVMDNPYTNESVTCYPGLSFIEAAYLYGYFLDSLKKNEYIRLQKVVTLLVTEGAELVSGQA